MARIAQFGERTTQEVDLSIQVLGVTDAEGTKKQRGGNPSLHMQWMVREEVYVHTTVHRLPVYRKGEMISRAMDKSVQERELVVNLPFHLEADGRRERIQLRQEIRKQGRFMGPESEDVIYISQPHGRTRGDGREELRLEELHVQVSQNRGERRAHGNTERL